MKATVLRRTLVLAVAAVVVTIVGPAQAAPLYYTSFEGNVGDLPADWGLPAGTQGDPGWRIDTLGDYRFDGSGTGLSNYTGDFDNGQSGSSFSNGTVESNFRSSPTGVYTGVAARIQPSSISCYAARLYGGYLQVYRFGGSGNDLLGSDSASGYNSGETWRIEMSLLDTQITSKVFDQTGAEIAAVTVNDSEFTEGTTGVRSNATAVWEDFQVSAPEGLNVDIGNPTYDPTYGHDVQAGFQSFARVHNTGSYTTSPQSQVFDSDLGLANQVDVKLSTSAANHN